VLLDAGAVLSRARSTAAAAAAAAGSAVGGGLTAPASSVGHLAGHPHHPGPGGCRALGHGWRELVVVRPGAAPRLALAATTVMAPALAAHSTGSDGQAPQQVSSRQQQLKQAAVQVTGPVHMVAPVESSTAEGCTRTTPAAADAGFSFTQVRCLICTVHVQ
jgi:hypothetical protein